MGVEYVTLRCLVSNKMSLPKHSKIALFVSGNSTMLYRSVPFVPSIVEGKKVCAGVWEELLKVVMQTESIKKVHNEPSLNHNCVMPVPV